MIIDGFEYIIHVNKPKSTLWRCSQHNRYKCRARAMTSGNQIYVKTVPHSHTRIPLDYMAWEMDENKCYVIYTDRLVTP